MIQTIFEENGIASLTMLDARNGNTFHPAFLNRLQAELELIRVKEPKVLLLQGTPEVFSAGACRRNLLNLCEGKVAVRDLTLSEQILNLPCPVIAAMEGHAVGGGLMLALCCDIVIAAKESRYGATFLSLGFTPGMGCTALLADLVGPYLAAEMMFTARTYRGSELSLRQTNINYIVARQEVVGLARNLATQMVEKEKIAMQLLKGALASRKKKLLAEAQQQEDRMHRICFACPSTRDWVERNYLQTEDEDTP